MGVIIIFGLFTLGIAATWMFHRTGWDLSWAARCYTPGGNLEGWTHGRDKLWALLFRYGEIPTVVLTMVAVVLLVTAKLGAANEAYTRPCLVVILAVVLGPAIVVNSILKPGWGRPRPVEVSNLGEIVSTGRYGNREARARGSRSHAAIARWPILSPRGSLFTLHIQWSQPVFLWASWRTGRSSE